jgi:hypothetical protein
VAVRDHHFGGAAVVAVARAYDLRR